MSENDRGGGYFLESLVLGVATLAIWAMTLLPYVYADSTGQNLRVCEDFFREAAPEDINVEEESLWVEYYACRDLEAQRQMAVWTGIAGTAAILGVVLLAFTLRETWKAGLAASHLLNATREANRININALSSTERPWLYVDDVSLASDLVLQTDENGSPKGGRVKVSVSVRNVGKVPAVGSELHLTLVAFRAFELEEMEAIKKKIEELGDKRKKLPRRQMLGHTVFPGQPFTFSMSSPIERNQIEKVPVPLLPFLFPVIVGAVSYTSPIDGETHQTGFTAYLDDSQRNAGVDGSEGTVPLNRLRLRRSFFSGVVD